MRKTYKTWAQYGGRASSLLKRFFGFRRPRNDRNWSLDLKILPEIILSDDHTITIKNIRNFSYQSVQKYTPKYYDRTFPLTEIRDVWFLVEPFSWLAAHTMLSFGLHDGTYISVSVEIRKKIGQRFSQLATLFFLRRHELVYVIGDEQDLIKLRTNYRKDKTYLYPMTLSSGEAQQLFVDTLKRAQYIQENPEFYNPFTNTCLTNLIDHINAVRTTHIPLSYKMWVAKYADVLMYEEGLIDQSLPFVDIQKKYFINERAHRHAVDPDFSKKIRTI